MKETLFLLPGLLCDRGLWHHQLDSLSNFYDVRVADYGLGETIEEFAHSVLSNAPEEFSVAGLSMGAYVALEVYRQAPDRVRRIALLDASPYADLPEHGDFRRQTMLHAKEHGLDAVVEKILPRLIHPARHEDEGLVKAIDAMAHRVGVKGFLRQQNALLTRKDYVDFLPKIEVECLVGVGLQDALTPPKISREMANVINKASLVEIENCGHLSSLEQPETVSALLRYWMQK